jgi:hypothetical protein
MREEGLNPTDSSLIPDSTSLFNVGLSILSGKELV